MPANLSPQVLDLARDIVRRGLDDTTLNTYRIGQNVAWRAWMAQAFTLTDDAEELVALSAQDEEGAVEFVTRTLGDLASGEPELRETLRVYIREEFSASRAARALYAHRNTILNRLARARELLPAPLEHRGLQVGLALEIVHWLGPRA